MDDKKAELIDALYFAANKDPRDPLFDEYLIITQRRKEIKKELIKKYREYMKKKK